MKKISNTIVDEIINDWIKETCDKTIILIKAVQSEDYEKAAIYKEHLETITKQTSEVIETVTGNNMLKDIQDQQQLIYDQLMLKFKEDGF